jgi:hypothetical protein
VGFLSLGNQTRPHLPLIHRKQPPCAAYAHPESFLGRDSPTFREGRLFATMAKRSYQNLQGTCSRRFLRATLYFFTPKSSSATRCNPSAYFRQVSEHYDDKPSQMGLGGCVYLYKALQSVAASVIAHSNPPSSFTVRNSISCAVSSVATRSSKTTQ